MLPTVKLNTLIFCALIILLTIYMWHIHSATNQTTQP